MRSASYPSLFLRSFVTQASWNYRTLIGTGITWALLPVSSRLGGEMEQEKLGLPSDEPFNSHPYLTPLALGALARSAEDGLDPDEVRSFRDALRSPLGSLGDKLIWGAWRPFCLLGGMLAATLGVRPTLAVGVTLVTYNVLHIVLRAWGLTVGLRLGVEVGAALKRARLAERSERVEAAGVLLFGILLGLLLKMGFDLSGSGFIWAAGGLVLIFVGAFGGEAVRRWAPVLLFSLIVTGLALFSGPVELGSG